MAVAVCAIVLLPFLSLPVRAADRLVVGDFSLGVNSLGVPEGWELKEKAGRAGLKVVEDDGVPAVRFQSTNASFSLQREVKANLGEYPILSWKWKVTQLPAGGDFRRSKTDDQAAQLFVAFNRRQTIVYMWDTTAPQGTIGDANAPPFMSIKVVVMRSAGGETGKWLTEHRNVYDDYRKFFGPTDKPPVVTGIRLQINSQHTKTRAESCFADVMFTKQMQAAIAPEDLGR